MVGVRCHLSEFLLYATGQHERIIGVSLEVVLMIVLSLIEYAHRSDLSDNRIFKFTLVHLHGCVCLLFLGL